MNYNNKAQSKKNIDETERKIFFLSLSLPLSNVFTYKGRTETQHHLNGNFVSWKKAHEHHEDIE